MILCIETSTAVLSVALARDGAVVCERVCTQPRSQAALTAPLVKEVLDAAGITAGECDAVCVSAGPGSYTGLRVGVSTAKGLAFGAGIPLLSMGTLDILVEGVEETPAFIVPMIDARRMEVYTAVYSADGSRLTEVEARVIGPDAFAEYLEHPNARFREAFPLARHMARRAQEDFDARKFQDVAYFEPFYLKDFIATVSKKNLW